MKFTKETAYRMFRTFVQAAAGFLATTGISVFVTNDYNVSKNIIFGLIGSAIAAGLAAVMNLENNNDNSNGDKETPVDDVKIEESEVDIDVT